MLYSRKNKKLINNDEAQLFLIANFIQFVEISKRRVDCHLRGLPGY